VRWEYRFTTVDSAEFIWYYDNGKVTVEIIDRSNPSVAVKLGQWRLERGHVRLLSAFLKGLQDELTRIAIG